MIKGLLYILVGTFAGYCIFVWTVGYVTPVPQSCSVAGCGVSGELPYNYEASDSLVYVGGTSDDFINPVAIVTSILIPDTVYVVDTVPDTQYIYWGQWAEKDWLGEKAIVADTNPEYLAESRGYSLRSRYYNNYSRERHYFYYKSDTTFIKIVGEEQTKHSEIVPIGNFTGLTTAYSPNGKRHILTEAEKWAPFEKRIIDNMDWGRRGCIHKRSIANKLACKSSERCVNDSVVISGSDTLRAKSDTAKVGIVNGAGCLRVDTLWNSTLRNWPERWNGFWGIDTVDCREPSRYLLGDEPMDSVWFHGFLGDWTIKDGLGQNAK